MDRNLPGKSYSRSASSSSTSYSNRRYGSNPTRYSGQNPARTHHHRSRSVSEGDRESGTGSPRVRLEGEDEVKDHSDAQSLVGTCPFMCPGDYYVYVVLISGLFLWMEDILTEERYGLPLKSLKIGNWGRFHVRFMWMLLLLCWIPLNADDFDWRTIWVACKLEKDFKLDKISLFLFLCGSSWPPVFFIA